VAIVRNLTLIKCALGHRTSWTTSVPVGGYDAPVARLGHTSLMVERKRFVAELPAARIQNQTTDLPYIASAPTHERRP
jgi:hypothetical protein